MKEKAGQKVRPAYFVYRGFWQSLDWLFPPSCAGCGKPGMRWCPACQRSIHQITGRVCQKCGQPVGGENLCQVCRVASPRYQQLRSIGEFSGPIREAIHHLKYRRDIGLGDALSVPLIEYFSTVDWKVDAVIPVPLSKERLAERGYNQSALIARPFALALGLAYWPDEVARIRDTGSQVGLSADARRVNVAGAFQAKRNKIVGKNILVIDDVTTTGATISACADSLLSAGAGCIYGLTIARAVLHSN